MPDHPIFTVGGTVQAGGGIYLPRPADDELLRHCLDGDFCYVLTARQMGKSSLMVRTAERLEAAGTRAVIIDLTRLGTTLQADQWYLGLLDELVEQLDLEVDYKAWWETHAHLGPTHRLGRFLRESVLDALDSPLVIFIDEIDTTLSLSFSDDFFAAIRACYNARSTDPAYKRLSFVLLGVATPGDLIRDPQRTPFNIGQRIGLTDFNFKQALPLAEGFDLPPALAAQVLKWVLDWTGGHPYLTQRLCRALLENPPLPPVEGRGEGEWNETSIAEVVEQTFFGEKSKQDGNLGFVRDMLTLRAPDVRKVLQAYAKVRAGKKVKNEEQSLVVSHLKISGVVREQDGFLAVRNRIYEHTFDQAWVKKSMPSSVPLRLAWASSIVAVIALLVAGYFGYQELTLSDAARAARFETRFAEATTPAGQLDNLSGLIKLADGAYASRAISLFQRMSQTEKLALFENVRDENDQLLLARQVYQRIYTGPPTPEGQQEQDDLMRAIGKSVRNADPPLESEIEDWLEGRLELANGNDMGAINKFNYALGSARANPAILLDLARAYVGQDKYENALQTLIEAAEADPQRIITIQARQLLNVQTGFGAYWQTQRENYPEFAKRIEVPMAEILPGSFQMGSNPETARAECQKYYDSCDIGNYQDEAPIHTVTLDAFEMDIYEVTNAEYALCVAAGVCSPPDFTGSYTRDSYYGDPAFDNYPVIYVTWFQADTYCSWRGARLPTEAEWEYAARGGQEGQNYPWGNVFEDGQANFCDTNCSLEWGNKDINDGYPDTSPVGSYPPNGYSLYDMAGNVWEWTADWYSAEYYATVEDGIFNPLGPAEGEYRVLRGGSWYSFPFDLRVSNRSRDVPSNGDDYLGFRCSR